MNFSETPQVWLSLNEASTYTRLSESRLRQLINNGSLRVTRSNGASGKILINRTWLDQMLLKGANND